MKQVQTHLSKRLLKYTQILNKIDSEIKKIQQWRLISGLSILLIAFLLSLPSSKLHSIVYFLFLLSLILFGFFVSIYKRKIHFKNQIQELIVFLNRQVSRREGRPHEKKLRFSIPTKDFCHDLYLVQGSQSLLSLIDETITSQGQMILVNLFKSHFPQKENILSRQKQIKDFCNQNWFYTRLLIKKKKTTANNSSDEVIENINHPLWSTPLLKKALLIYSVWILFVLSFFIPQLRTYPLFKLFVFAFPLLNLFLINNWLGYFSKVIGLSHYLSEVFPIFSLLEKKALYNKSIESLCPTIHKNLPSKIQKKLNLSLSLLGTQTNPLLHLILNIFFPWTLTGAILTRYHINKIKSFIPACFDELAELEVLGSLSLFYKYQTQTFPTFDSKLQFEAVELFHPLIERTKTVPNTFRFSENKTLALLTGSNMSGKSTFLRTVGINQILANMGAPVFARSMTTSLFRVETCITVTDSLRDGFSYFYSEVHRLKEIFSLTAENKPLLILVDELFRGTNNKERHIGSQNLIERWSKLTKALVFISSHDLELADLEKHNQSIENFHFKESLTDSGEMHFNYKIQHGPSPTTNALFIMKKAGLF